MITERYTRWVAMLAQSDANLVILAGIALAVVIAWQLSARVPAPWARYLRWAFLAASAGVMVQLVTGFQPSPAQLIGVGLLISVGLGIFQLRRASRPLAAEKASGQ